jgi:hypothetical protein
MLNKKRKKIGENMNKNIILILLFGVGIILVLGLNLVRHEDVHRQIYLQDGCEVVRVDYGLSSNTHCIDEGYVQSDTAKIENINNEIVNYNNEMLIIS